MSPSTGVGLERALLGGVVRLDHPGIEPVAARAAAPAAGWSRRRSRVSTCARTRTNSPGHSRSSSLGNCALSRIVLVRLVDLVVDQQQLAGRELLRVVLVEGEHRRPAPRSIASRTSPRFFCGSVKITDRSA